MKPNFALDLSHEGINLLHRGKGGWTLVGSVALDDPDMSARLDDLRRSAAMLESGGFTTKLIIPNSQILYTTVDAAGPDDIAREVQIRAALDGLTPYAVGDLVFDWRAEGDRARVAVLARETMDEAEAFASEYKFNPVSFAARPGRGDFSGEPFFGKTRAAARLLAPGVRVEPDASPVPRNPRALELGAEARVDQPEDTAAAPTPKPEPEPEADPRSDLPAEAQPRPSVTADGVASDAADSATPQDRAAEAVTDEAPAPETPAPRQPETQPEAAGAPKAPRRKPRAERDEAGRVSLPPLAPFPPTPDEIDQGLPPAPRGLAPATRPSKPPRTPSAPTPEPSADLPPVEPVEPTTEAETAAPPDDESATSGTGATVAAAFQSRRATLPEAGPAPGRPDERLREISPRIGIPAQPAPERPEPPAAPGLEPVGEPGPGAAQPSRAPAPAPRPAPLGPDRLRSQMADALSRPLPSPGKPLEKKAKGPGALAGIIAAARGVTARAGTGIKTGLAARSEARRTRAAARAEAASEGAKAAPQAEPAAAAPEQPAAKAPAASGRKGLSGLLPRRNKSPGKSEAEARRAREAEALTVFGARKDQATRGKPKYLGLTLTLLLLLAMAALAIWSSTVVEDDVTLFNPDPESQVTADPAPVAADEPVADPDPARPDVPPAEMAAPLSPEEAEARYAATGIWQRAPEPLGEPESTRLSSLDPAASGASATVRAPLPEPGEIPGPLRDALLAAPVPPPPAGTSFDLDENGLVRPTPEGALSPTGILVFAGPPAVVPPPRPGDLPDVAPPFALPDVPNRRPQPRPADFAPPANPIAPPDAPAPETAPEADPTPEAAPDPEPGSDDNAALPAEPDAQETAGATALAAAPRPEPRPEDLVVSTASAGAAIDAAVADVVAAALVNPTELAVAASRKPSARPADFAAIVDSAREAASDGSRVAAAPEVDDEPESVAASAVPVIPTSASVATQATLKNAINLREINLIGIYGTSSSRRALVRMKNGRYVKVEVGDALDGGRVTSITASELTYQKGNRAYKLAVLPLG